MLVLTRQIGDEILLDNGRIKFKILYERNGTIAIGISAPSTIEIERKGRYLKPRLNTIKQRTIKEHLAFIEERL